MAGGRPPRAWEAFLAPTLHQLSGLEAIPSCLSSRSSIQTILDISNLSSPHLTSKMGSRGYCQPHSCDRCSKIVLYDPDDIQNSESLEIRKLEDKQEKLRLNAANLLISRYSSQMDTVSKLGYRHLALQLKRYLFFEVDDIHQRFSKEVCPLLLRIKNGYVEQDRQSRDEADAVRYFGVQVSPHFHSISIGLPILFPKSRRDDAEKESFHVAIVEFSECGFSAVLDRGRRTVLRPGTGLKLAR